MTSTSRSALKESRVERVVQPSAHQPPSRIDLDSQASFLTTLPTTAERHEPGVHFLGQGMGELLRIALTTTDMTVVTELDRVDDRDLHRLRAIWAPAVGVGQLDPRKLRRLRVRSGVVASTIAAASDRSGCCGYEVSDRGEQDDRCTAGDNRRQAVDQGTERQVPADPPPAQGRR